jgi:hypothetical protein
VITGAHVVGGVGLLGGVWVAAEQGYYLLHGLRSSGWPSTDGRMLEARAGALPDQVPGGGRWYPGGLCLAYEYTVGGQRYVGSRSSWRGHWPGLGTAVRLALHYQQQQKVRVWYDPTDPRRAVLRPGAGAWNIFGTAVGLGLAWGGWTLVR